VFHTYLSTLQHFTDEQSFHNPVCIPIVQLPEALSRHKKVIAQWQQRTLPGSLILCLHIPGRSESGALHV